MSSILSLLLETVLITVLDPVVLIGAIVVTLALCSGLVAHVIELIETRPPRRIRMRAADERTSAAATT
jgi:hypothetical protein